MNYKSIIKSRKLRLMILECLSFIPDNLMIKLQYYIKTGRKLNLKNPQRYTEKLQWYKLNYRYPLMVKCVDKYDVREYVKECNLEHILNECYGVYESPEEIDFNQLPDKFVIKDTLGSGGNSIIICEDKNKANIEEYKKIMKEWTNTKLKRNAGREWPYYVGKRHRIIIEKYIESNKNKGGLIDYKFFCFDGEVYYIYVIADRDLGTSAGLAIFDKDFNLLPYRRCDENILKRRINKPKNHNEMIKCAEILSRDFPHARIDLYDQNDKIIFGEITFYDGSGYMKYSPDSFDYDLGKIFKLEAKDGQQ